MAPKELLNAAEDTSDALYRVQCRLTHLENKHKRLVALEEEGVKGELETIMEKADAIMVGSNGYNTHAGTKTMVVSKSHFNALIRECRKGVFIKMRQNTPQLCCGDEWLANLF